MSNTSKQAQKHACLVLFYSVRRFVFDSFLADKTVLYYRMIKLCSCQHGQRELTFKYSG